jgi:hypothetical protein
VSWLRKPGSLAATVALHAALFAWAGTLAPDEVRQDEIDLVEVELVELGVARDAPLAPQAGDAGDDVPRSVPLPPSPMPKPRPRRPQEVAAEEDVPPVEREPVEVDAVDPSPEPVAPVVLAVPASAGDTAEQTVAATRPSAGRSTGVRGSKDFASYGAKIVQIVLDELDRNPVRGIGREDTIEVELEILPNGDLAWKGDGRFGFARVLRSSLGSLRTRQVLRRIEHASSRFPQHPAGFSRRHYIVGVTVNFRDLG